jgi:hypothetical protein
VSTIAAGAAGITALNVVTYLDMVLRGPSGELDTRADGSQS